MLPDGEDFQAHIRRERAKRDGRLPHVGLGGADESMYPGPRWQDEFQQAWDRLIADAVQVRADLLGDRGPIRVVATVGEPIREIEESP